MISAVFSRIGGVRGRIGSGLSTMAIRTSVAVGQRDVESIEEVKKEIAVSVAEVRSYYALYEKLDWVMGPNGRYYPKKIEEMQAYLGDIGGNRLGIVSVDPLVFGAQIREDLMHRTVVWQLARRRAGTASVKTKYTVNGSNRKLRPQKGTGRARIGSRRSPHLRGGGVVHGPVPRSYDYKFPANVRRRALVSALSLKFAQNNCEIVTQQSVALDTPHFSELYNKLAPRNMNHLSSAFLIITHDLQPLDMDSDNLYRASLLLDNVEVISYNSINVYDLLRYKKVLITDTALVLLQDTITSKINRSVPKRAYQYTADKDYLTKTWNARLLPF